MVHAMLFCLLAYEVPALRRGAMSLECPREVYNQVGWSEWTASLPQEWTLFLPLNSRYIPMHDRQVTTPTSTNTEVNEPVENSNSVVEESSIEDAAPIPSATEEHARSLSFRGVSNRSIT